MKQCLLLITLLVSIHTFSQQSFQSSSPDKTVKIQINTTNQLTYNITIDGKPIISNASIDLKLSNNISLSNNLTIKSTKIKSINEIIVAQIPDTRKNIPNSYNELTINFKNNFTIIFRAYNDGVAYRIATNFKDSITIISPATHMRMHPSSTNATMQISTTPALKKPIHTNH